MDRVINCFVSNSNSNFLTLSEIPFSSHHLSKVWIVGMCAADGTNVLHCYSWTAGDIYIYIFMCTCHDYHVKNILLAGCCYLNDIFFLALKGISWKEGWGLPFHFNSIAIVHISHCIFLHFDFIEK